MSSSFMPRTLGHSVPVSWGILFRVFIAVLKYHDQRASWEEGYFSLQSHKTRTQIGQDPEGRSCCRGHRGDLLTGLLLKDCSSGFLIEPRTPNPGIAPPRMGWALPNQSGIKKMSFSLIRGSFLSNDFRL